LKTLTSLTVIAALIGGISLASAQNAGGPAGPGASPSNINKGETDDSSKQGSQSGSQGSGSAMKGVSTTTGTGLKSPAKESADKTVSPASPNAGEKQVK
jgi:hypothetical protein